LGDFTLSSDVTPIVLLACLIGAIGTFVAVALLDLIALNTNLVFYQRFGLPRAAAASGV
jgi:hypothetical protein